MQNMQAPAHFAAKHLLPLSSVAVVMFEERVFF